MTLPELLGSVFGFLFGVTGVVVAAALGHGSLTMVVAFPVAALVGWVFGAAISGPVDRAVVRRTNAEGRHDPGQDSK